MSALERLRAERDANRDDEGRIKNHALDLRFQAEERRLLVEAHGLEPEGAGDRLAASAGELSRWPRPLGLPSGLSPEELEEVREIREAWLERWPEARKILG